MLSCVRAPVLVNHDHLFLQIHVHEYSEVKDDFDE